MKRQGRPVSRASPDDVCIFPNALGKYVKNKLIPLVIQQQIITQVSKEECDLYNNTYFDYMKSKRKLGALDERIDMQTIKIDYNRNDTPLSKQKYRFQEVKEDVNSILTRHRHRGSMNNIIHQNNPDFAPIERKGRSSLIPFRISMGSNLS